MAKINSENAIQTNSIKSLAKDTEGLSTVEYVIILFLIAIIGIVAWRQFGSQVKTKVEAGTTQVGGL
ncbi:MAG: Flp family type IVb pilin [Deltaproteobacteria bacterium]|nr:Flp family type IVb pilin [Deltaproteobacteria bacterium]